MPTSKSKLVNKSEMVAEKLNEVADKYLASINAPSTFTMPEPTRVNMQTISTLANVATSLVTMLNGLTVMEAKQILNITSIMIDNNPYTYPTVYPTKI